MKLRAGSMPDDMVSTFLSATKVEGRSGKVHAPALEDLILDGVAFQGLGDRVDGQKALDRLSNGKIDLNLPPFETLESLCSALASCAGPRGRLMMTKCYAHDDYGLYYDMVGQWGGSHFYVVSEHHWSRFRLTSPVNLRGFNKQK